MAENGGARSVAASIVGWMVVLVIAWFLFGSIFGTIRFLVRVALIAVLIVGLLWLYFRLKGGSDS